MLMLWKLFAGSLAIAQPAGTTPSEPASAEAQSAVLAAALDGPSLALTMRGAKVSVKGRADPAEGGCAARLTARMPGRDKAFARLLRWSDVAWSGTTPEGDIRIAFFDHEGRLPVDQIAFRASDPGAFRMALAQTMARCRSGERQYERVLTLDHAGVRSCYFKQLPQLQLIDGQGSAASAEPARAILTLLSRERPEAEMQLLLERTAEGGSAVSYAAPRAEVAFVYAAERLSALQIAGAAFALDAAPVTAGHSVALYGDTRVRISLDRMAPGGGDDDAKFTRQLETSGEVRLTLQDAARQDRAQVHFDAGRVLTEARAALSAVDWSCAAAVPAPAPAAQWVAAP